jgi:hypothetical protein
MVFDLQQKGGEAGEKISALSVLDLSGEEIADYSAKIKAMWEELAGCETRINQTLERIKEYQGRIDEKLKRGIGGDKSRETTTALSPIMHEEVRRLKQENWTDEQIASTLGIGLGEVRLILLAH